MGKTLSPEPVMPVCALMSSDPAAFDWAIEKYASMGWPVGCASERFEFTLTDYYEAEMGPGLLKWIVAFDTIVDPQGLADWKLQSNEWEAEYSNLVGSGDNRSLNLDPGYLTLAKFILATTKDRDHRIYLREGIYAEVTLSFARGQWNASRWTYPDYMLDEAQDFLVRARDRCRDLLKQHSRSD